MIWNTSGAVPGDRAGLSLSLAWAGLGWAEMPLPPSLGWAGLGWAGRGFVGSWGFPESESVGFSFSRSTAGPRCPIRWHPRSIRDPSAQ